MKRSLAGWMGYAGFADTYNFRRRLLAGFRLRRGAESEQADRQGDDTDGQKAVSVHYQLPLGLVIH